MKLRQCQIGNKVLLATVITALNLFADGEPKIPTLNWMEREKVTNAVKDVVMKILREYKSLGYKSHAEKKGEGVAASAGDGNILPRAW